MNRKEYRDTFLFLEIFFSKAVVAHRINSSTLWQFHPKPPALSLHPSLHYLLISVNLIVWPLRHKRVKKITKLLPQPAVICEQLLRPPLLKMHFAAWLYLQMVEPLQASEEVGIPETIIKLLSADCFRLTFNSTIIGSDAHEVSHVQQKSPSIATLVQSNTKH